MLLTEEERMTMFQTQIRRKLNKKGDYEIKKQLICIHYTKSGKVVLHDNFQHIILSKLIKQ